MQFLPECHTENAAHPDKESLPAPAHNLTHATSFHVFYFHLQRLRLHGVLRALIFRDTLMPKHVAIRATRSGPGDMAA